VHWTYDTWALANGIGSTVVRTAGDSWFFITADYAFGHALERDIEAAATRAGARVAGRVRHPLNTQDFSSFLLQAQTSKAKVIALANVGGDTTNVLRQAAELGVNKAQHVAGSFVFVTDVHRLGLEKAQGLLLVEAFYWDANEGTRAFARRFAERTRGSYPTMIHAGVYASVLHYLKAVESINGDDGPRVIARMKDMPTDDPLFGRGVVRSDGRKVHPMYLFEVKKPSESRGPWDYYKRRATIPADQAFRPVEQGGCGLPARPAAVASIASPPARPVDPPRAEDPMALERRRLEEARQQLEAERQELERRRREMASRAATPVAVPGNIDFGTYNALVIGNESYQHIARLKTPVADAVAVADALRRDYGFGTVTLLKNATRDQMLKALDDQRRKLGPADNLLIYYAGHGFLDQRTSRGYWLPVDAEPDSRLRWLSEIDVTDTLKALNAKHVEIIADSCFSGSLLRDVAVSLDNADVVTLARKKARVAMTSGGLEPVVDGGGGGHSTFARAFLEVLRENPGVADLTKIFTLVRTRVALNAAQTPQIAPILNAGHEGGDFLFVRRR
jgi:uncharacterized caspase-like protein